MRDVPTFLNFAYGSNMLGARLRARVPSARRVAVACLRGHTLRWHKVSVDGSGKCDAEVDGSPGACVWGVVYEIALAEKAQLDAAEGLGNGYAERIVQVVAQGGNLETHLYVATRIDHGGVPYDWYKALVVAGARENELPHDYVAFLEAASAKRDTDAVRREKNLMLLGDEA